MHTLPYRGDRFQMPFKTRCLFRAVAFISLSKQFFVHAEKWRWHFYDRRLYNQYRPGQNLSRSCCSSTAILPAVSAVKVSVSGILLVVESLSSLANPFGVVFNHYPPEVFYAFVQPPLVMASFPAVISALTMSFTVCYKISINFLNHH